MTVVWTYYKDNKKLYNLKSISITKVKNIKKTNSVV